ncbi:programmed cell death protein 2-like [Papilio machaon]|uniref:programmed cell death protein 2-like n=1 Tax=Papilio machaon TaxID=76193 RepID=UPI001E665A0C|nr:programmed cell death protein 2-like [Papilio machaon]
MAKRQGKVYLGYEEEIIGEKNQVLLTYKMNKIGGIPNWPPLDNLNYSSKCPLCGLYRMLIVQCYAPLENSVYHRTLYVFACISPNCWNLSEGWECVRSQIQESSGTKQDNIIVTQSAANLAWCNAADEWDENDNGDSMNGNVMNVDNEPANNGMRNSDDDESNSYELETVEQALGNLQVFDAHNANMSPQGAVGSNSGPEAAAELEGGDEPGLVIVETPTATMSDIEALLHQTAELPVELRNKLMRAPMQFIPKYIYVEEEYKNSCLNDDRVTELLNKYKNENELDLGGFAERGAGAGAGGGDEEAYEEAAPLHGDKLFHAFITRLKNNPGQILRYTRDEAPILGAPLANNSAIPESPSVPNVCSRCGSRLICELQLVPEFADTLKISLNDILLSHLHFLSVLVFTCSQSCWQPMDTVVNEIVVFQPEIV